MLALNIYTGEGGAKSESGKKLPPVSRQSLLTPGIFGVESLGIKVSVSGLIKKKRVEFNNL